jgi:hypothetical protein
MAVTLVLFLIALAIALLGSAIDGGRWLLFIAIVPLLVSVGSGLRGRSRPDVEQRH